MSQDWRISTKELVLSALVRCAAGRKKVSVLIDTGAKIPLVFRQGLFDPKVLKKACFPVHFSTADGQSMEGGTHGLFLEFRLPVWSRGRLISAKTCSLFAYEANIHGVDIIMGYPFLKVFNLCVDAHHDRLAVSPEGPEDDSSVQAQPTARLEMPQAAEAYDIDTDGALRGMFGCTCATATDESCPLAMYHHIDMKSVEPLDVEPQVVDCLDKPLDVEVHEASPSTSCSMTTGMDDWGYVPLCRMISSIALTCEAKQALCQGSFEVMPNMFKRILDQVQVTPTVDAFASKTNAKLKNFWTQHDDAFKQDWGSDTLWACPPFSQLDAVVEKICMDKAEGILLIPMWKHQPWFEKLEGIAISWWDVPQDMSVLQTPSGTVIPPRKDMFLRVVVFNATEAIDWKTSTIQ